jgi:hypothetical protein
MGALSRLLWWRPPCVLRTVIVNLCSEKDVAIRGVLWGYRGSWLTLKEAYILRAGIPPTPLDGDAVLHRSNVSFLQVLDADVLPSVRRAA